MKKTIAVNGVCGWPNLTVMPDGSIITTIFNQPTHGMAEGEVECHRSTDGGETWSYYSTPVLHEPGKNRMNVACGLTVDGSFLVICGGWDNRVAKGQPVIPYEESNRIPAVICRSKDGGKTFKVTDFTYQVPGNPLVLVPYGDICRVGKRLACACYTCNKAGTQMASYMVFSEDDGYTWTSHAVISEDNYNETFVYFLDDSYGIAMARSTVGQHLDQFVTEDGGLNWKFSHQVTGDGMHPGHVLGLSDGALLLSCSIRLKNNWGIGVARSSDNGNSWTWLNGLCNFGAVSDGGYPASVQLEDGSILTHYYVSGVPFNEQYFVGQVHWDIKELFK